MEDAYIDSARQGPGPFHHQQDILMTYLDIVFRYGAAPGEAALRAIDGMREVYGIRGVQFNEAERTYGWDMTGLA